MVSETKPAVALLAEDSEDDAYFFRRTLQKSGSSCSLEHVSNGADAIAFLHRALSLGADQLPRIVFLDLKMPMVNGFEVLAWMRKQTPLAEIPVVVLSGSERSDDKARAIANGATDYLVKPLSAAELRRLLSTACPPSGGKMGEPS